MKLSDLSPGISIAGRWPQAVTVVSVAHHGDDAASLVLRYADGTFAEEMVFAADVTSLTTVDDTTVDWTFSAAPGQFKLATEALRIRMAGVHDPMVAVATSDISPLPHQIRAVYGELLPRTPLRFLLADDPGAGKTIMAGLYAKELILRGDLTRMLIVAPGGLVEQWQDELDSKFGITATLLTREVINASIDSDPFRTHPFLIARMDQLARDEEIAERLGRSEWDLVVVDEAHRMSANWWGGELRKTKRFALGQLMGSITRHLLLMTATPHSGSEENFQAFLSLLDPDRFEGQFRPGAHATETAGLMRRMVKEELLTFDGRRLFPERIAETVPYRLSPGERQLYDAVTHYVREEMNRAEQHSDSPHRRTVGFALTVLQRRLASSTHAIVRSLERRRIRLTTKRAEMASGQHPISEPGLRLPNPDDFDDPDQFNAEEYERLEEEVVDAATAARTVAELDVEIAILDDLVALARQVRDSGVDRKWAELRNLLTDHDLLSAPDGERRKLIVFTEHRDTLEYLTRQIRNVLGNDEAVVTIHGGTRRSERKSVRERFTQDPARQVLVATDAAGEGLNLQAAHLMINYDLPWNPNRLEQRFGRIHRIGQSHVCRLWNIVADETREGHVYARLLEKMEQQRNAYGGKLFDILGDAFAEKPLRTLLMDAIRYGDDPARIDEIERVVDSQIAEGCGDLVRERALAKETLNPLELDRLRREMDEASARRLQPYYIEKFFVDAFSELGGRLSRREKRRYQITNVPGPLRHRPGRREHFGKPVVAAYERVTFEPNALGGRDTMRAELLAPGHPLLDAVLDATIEKHLPDLQRGTTLFDPLDSATEPYVLLAISSEVLDGHQHVVSKRFAFVELRADGSVVDAGPAPHLDLAPPPSSAADAVDRAREHRLLDAGLVDRAMGWAASIAAPHHLADARSRLLPTIEKTTAAVRTRLISQVNYLDGEAARRRESDATGRTRKPRNTQSPDRLEARARELERRLAVRTDELSKDAALVARPPTLTAAMLVVPAGMVGGSLATLARDTAVTERRAVDAILAAETALGRQPEEMPHNNKGYDIRSVPPRDSLGAARPTVFLEVKGRVEGAEDFFVTYNEVLHARNTGEQHRLALVSVSDAGPEHDRIRYVTDYFRDFDMGSTDVSGVQLDWHKVWSKGRPPH
ncbi:helicase-related protein [Gordonia mangrovi]|uniref:helicase-related protein n=1 Tax=Gordonia mangrovi TaxID=2665643 RepID=UPI0021ACF887|nr:helicase-related protein [Gordonia mangrovi]UVF77276.1 helicase-related protein [Gordonia mangrovi]